jgi:phosphoadenosine phosphosulfate reductase
MLGIAFSGGKDSLACWYLYKQMNPIVFWVNTGKGYPETLEIIEEIRKEAKEFIEIKSNQQLQQDTFGLPSDIVPINNTLWGMTVTGQKPVKVQSYLGCCYENIVNPMLEAIKKRGITQLIRGQRLEEGHKSTALNGTVVDGVEYLQPIEHWTKQQVFDYLLKQRGSLPEHYYIEHSSLDCYDCTAFVAESKDRIAWTKKKHPELFNMYEQKMNNLKSSINSCLKAME